MFAVPRPRRYQNDDLLEVEKHHNCKHSPRALCSKALCYQIFVSSTEKSGDTGSGFLDDACSCPSTRSTVHNAQCSATIFVCKFHFFQLIIFSGTLPVDESIIDKQARFRTWTFIHRKVLSSRPVHYSILELFGQRSQYKTIKFPLHKPSENLKICY